MWQRLFSTVELWSLLCSGVTVFGAEKQPVNLTLPCFPKWPLKLVFPVSCTNTFSCAWPVCVFKKSLWRGWVGLLNCVLLDTCSKFIVA